VTATHVRRPSPTEVEAIAALLDEHATAYYGEPDLSPGAVSEWFGSDDVVIRVGERDGVLACYGDAAFSVDGSRVNLDVRARPSRAEAAAHVLDALERIATGRGARVARAFAASTETAYAELLRGRGYRVIRHSFRMTIALAGEQPEPEWPAGISVRSLAPGEERLVHAVAEEAFADHWEFEPQPYERWARFTFEGERFDPSLNFLAVAGDEVAGICLCSLHWSADSQRGWVGTLGVRPRWRRRGIAMALLRHAFAELSRRGCTRVGLGVDALNTTGAVALYERAGMCVERRQDTYERAL